MGPRVNTSLGMGRDLFSRLCTKISVPCLAPIDLFSMTVRRHVDFADVMVSAGTILPRLQEPTKYFLANNK